MPHLTTLAGLKTSSLCFGCMQFGGAATETESGAMFDACRDAGVNFFDTAHTYTNGGSERILGRLIRQEREKFIVATKAAYTGGSGRENILRQFDESRSRLGLDEVDVLYLHRWDSQTALEETLQVLAELKASDRIRYIGVSNFSAWQVMKAQSLARDLGVSIDVLQPMYSLVKRQAEVEILPMALAEGLAVASYSPLAAGLLSGKYSKGGTGRLTSDKRYAARYGQDWMQQTARDFAKLAAEMEIEPATLAVAWAAHHPAVTTPIISARTTEQLKASLAAHDVILTSHQYRQIEALSLRPAPATDRLEEPTH